MSAWTSFVVVRQANSSLALTLSVVVLLLAVAFAAAAPSTDEFFRAVPDSARNYAANRVYPQGRIFPFSLYSVGGGGPNEVGQKLPEEEVQAALARVKADGFTMIGPQYELNDRILDDAEKHGLNALYTISGRGLLDMKASQRVSTAEIQQCIREQVEAARDYPQVTWWYVTPEELRYWRKGEIEYLEIACETIRETDPQRRPVWMYDPGHRNAGGLSHTARHLDILGKGLYTNYSGHRHSRIWVRWSIEQEKQGIEAVGREVIPIAVPEMFRQPPGEELDLIPAWVRHDVYLALITGAKGVVVFSMRQRPNFPAHEAYYQAYAQTAKEICGEQGLGQVFLFGEWRDDVSLQIFEGLRWLELKIKKQMLRYPAVSFADIAYGSSRYLAEQPVSVRVRGLPLEEVLAYNVFAGDEPTEIAGGQFSLHFAPLEVKCLRFAREG